MSICMNARVDHAERIPRPLWWYLEGPHCTDSYQRRSSHSRQECAHFLLPRQRTSPPPGWEIDHGNSRPALIMGTYHEYTFVDRFHGNPHGSTLGQTFFIDPQNDHVFIFGLDILRCPAEWHLRGLYLRLADILRDLQWIDYLPRTQ